MIGHSRIRGIPTAEDFPQENAKTPDITRGAVLAIVEGLVINRRGRGREGGGGEGGAGNGSIVFTI